MLLALMAVVYAFAPTLAMLSTRVLKDQPVLIRYGVATAIVLACVAGMMLVCGWWLGPDAMPWVLYGALIEWPGQVVVLICLRLLLDSGAGIS